MPSEQRSGHGARVSMDINVLQAAMRSFFLRALVRYGYFTLPDRILWSLRQRNRVELVTMQHAISLRELDNDRYEVAQYAVERMASEAFHLAVLNPELLARDCPDARAVVFMMRGYKVQGGELTLEELGMTAWPDADIPSYGPSPLGPAYAAYSAYAQARDAMYDAVVRGMMVPSEMLDVTNFASPLGAREYIAGLPPPPNCRCEPERPGEIWATCPTCKQHQKFGREELTCPQCGLKFWWIYNHATGKWAAAVPTKEEEVTTESLKELLGEPTHEAGKVKFNSEGGFSIN